MPSFDEGEDAVAKQFGKVDKLPINLQGFRVAMEL